MSKRVFYLSHFHLYDATPLVLLQTSIEELFAGHNFVTYANDDASFVLADDLQEVLALDRSHCAHLQIDTMDKLDSCPTEVLPISEGLSRQIVADLTLIVNAKQYWTRHTFQPA